MYSWGGDSEAMRLCLSLFGKERCKDITRLDAFHSLDEIEGEVEP